MPSQKTPASLYDPAKRYTLVLTQVVQIDGFVVRPSQDASDAPIVSGEFANLIDAKQPGAIAGAREAAPDVDAPAPAPTVFEDADGVRSVA